MKTLKKLLCLILAFMMLCSGGTFAFATEGETGVEEIGSGGIIIDDDASEDLLLYGNARKTERDGEKCVELTPLNTWRSGSAWYNKQISASSGFTIMVDYWAGGGRADSYGGADGIVLTFSKEPGLGEQGEYMGFVPGSYGVELDSYFQNPGDPYGKHVAVIQGEVSNHLSYVLDDRVDDSVWHTLKVEYVPGTMKVYIDDELLITQEDIILPEDFYLGISAATGAGFNYHLIKNFFLSGIVSKGDSFGEDNDPIIIIPGIMGSRLFTSGTVFDESTRVWDPPKNLSILELNEKADINGDYQIYVRPCENQNDLSSGTVAKYGREYGAEVDGIGTYKNLVDGLCEAFPEREVYVFSYDWRYGNADSAKKLSAAINSIGASKVDLVCHSMGGLVASSYMAQFGSEKIDKIITCGTPYEGAPKLINAVQNWDVVGADDDRVGKGDFNDFLLGFLGGLTKKVKSAFFGVAELTPTKNYVSKFPMWEDSAWPFNIADNKLSYDKYVETCREVFGKDNFNSAKNFQESIHGNNGYNILLDYDKSYFLIGTNHKTITAVKFQWAGNDIDQRLYESDLSYSTLGDGTVPYYSATIMEKIEDLSTDRWVTKSVNHTQTIQNKECIAWIKDILKYGVSTAESDAPVEKKFTVIRIACPVDVTVTCGDEILSSVNGEMDISSDFGRIDIIGENDEIKMLCIDTSDDYNIVVTGTGEGTMDYAVRFFDEEENQYDERIFEDVPVTEETVIYTDANEEGEIVLEVDKNGDGNIDETWTAEENEWVTADDENKVSIEYITIEADRTELFVGEQANLSVARYPENATYKVAARYISSDESVVTVDENGTITAVSVGTVTVKAVATNGMEAEIEITVPKVFYGDMNLDGKINIADANIIRRYAAKLVELDDEQFRAADVNGDGKVNIADANLVRRYIAKLITYFPVMK